MGIAGLAEEVSPLTAVAASAASGGPIAGHGPAPGSPSPALAADMRFVQAACDDLLVHGNFPRVLLYLTVTRGLSPAVLRGEGRRAGTPERPGRASLGEDSRVCRFRAPRDTATGGSPLHHTRRVQGGRGAPLVPAL